MNDTITRDAPTAWRYPEPPAPVQEPTKGCTGCREQIPKTANRCPYCNRPTNLTPAEIVMMDSLADVRDLIESAEIEFAEHIQSAPLRKIALSMNKITERKIEQLDKLQDEIEK